MGKTRYMIFVTGGTGLVGSHLIVELASKAKQIVALKRPSSDISLIHKLCQWYNLNVEEVNNKITWVDGNLLDPVSIHDAMGGIKEVYHCAAMVSFNPKHHKKMIETNVQGTANLVNTSLENKIEKFCFVSSVAALGDPESDKLIDEETTRDMENGHSGYSKSKYYSEMEVWRGITEGLKGIIVNPSVILGPGNWDTGSCRMFSTTAKGMPFYTTGGTGFVDVRDVVSIMIKLMEQEAFGERFCLSAENANYHQFFSHLAIALKKRPPHIKSKPWMLKMISCIESFLSHISDHEPTITAETARSAFQKSEYSNRKIREYLKISFIPLEQTINDIATLFLKEK